MTDNRERTSMTDKDLLSVVEEPHLDGDWLAQLNKPGAVYGDDSGIITMFVDVAEQLNVYYANVGEYEPPRATIGLVPERAVQLRDALTKAIASWRRDVKASTQWRNQLGMNDPSAAAQEP